MPNTNRGTSLFLGNAAGPDNIAVNITSTSPGSASTTGSFTPYAPGDIGVTFEYQDKTYTIAILDSGATSANTVGAPAVNNLLFWKSKTNRIVTNDYRQCLTPTAPNVSAAGILRNTPAVPLGTGGTMIAMLIRGFGIPVKAGTTAIGTIMANTSANTCSVVTATSTFLPLGTATTTDSAGLATCNVDIPQLP